jgi:hypothetical protein
MTDSRTPSDVVTEGSDGMKVVPISFALVLMVFNDGYQRDGRATNWSSGVLRWAYRMGRRQSKGKG